MIIEVLRMSLFMDSSQEDTFRTMMDYFTGRRDKILVSLKPSLVRAETGSWFSLSRGTAKGEVQTTITKRKSRSYVNFNFDFTKEYVAGFIVAIIGAIACSLLISYVARIMFSGYPSWNAGNTWFAVNLISIGSMILIVTVGMALEASGVSLTKRRFIEEFNMFAQSLQTKK